MAEQSLYRRHRPQSFAEVVGQENVVRTLSNAIERNRVHHAYLFVGSRGTGKTSMAKILARSLNCVEGPTLTPCGVCESCVSIARGTSLDVIEMDAASNRSVDDIRELRDRVSYAPAGGHWKVYILDEAHMLTREAWNAFLKTLEEPPPNTVFVLATTEPHKVMPTIVDRCQRFDFARPTPENIAEVLRRVSTAEGIEIADDALGAVARAANGSFRDALGTLDQLAAYSGAQIATEDVMQVLGITDSDLLLRATDAIAGGDGRGVLELSAELARSGRDPSRFAGDLIAHLRRLLVVRTLGDVPSHFFLTGSQAERLQAQAERLGEVELVRAIDELSAAVAAVREGDEARMTIELAMLRAARPEIDPSARALAHRLERLERGTASAPPPSETPKAPVAEPAAPAKPTPPADLPPAPAPDADDPPDEGPAAAGGTPDGDGDAAAEQPPAPYGDEGASTAAASNPVEAFAQGAVATAGQVITDVGGALDLDRLARLWPAVIDQVRQSGSEFLSATFEAARPVAVDSERSTVEIGFPPSAAFNKRKAEAKENRDRLADALRTIVGARLRPTYVLLDSEPEPAAEPEPGQERSESVDEGELVERFKAEFDAEELIDDPEEGES